MPLSLDELKALYAQKGATVRREYETEGGTQYVDEPVDLGGGIYATETTPIIGYEGIGENQQPIYGEKQFTGFSKSEGDKNYYYNPEGQLYHVEEEDSFWDQFGPMIMTAATMGGGAGLLGSTLFPSLSASAASAAGGALLGGANAAFTDQDILKGALLGGAASAGGMELGDTGLKVADAAKAYNFAQNPTLAGAASLASPYVSGTQIGDTGMSIGDVFKGVGTAQALTSGDDQQIFRALTGLAKDQGGSLKSSLAGFEASPEDFIEGYFQPGGEGYIAPGSQDITVSEQPENIDALLRSLSPYAVDGGTSVFAQEEDIPEMETVSKRPITSIESILGTPNIMQDVEADIPEMTITDDRPKTDVPGIRTKDIVSDIPDFITPDQIDRLNLDTKLEDILQTVTPTKTVTPGGTKITTPAGTKSVQQSLANLGLGGMQQAASQDPYADIKLMQEMFGPDIAYKLLSLGGNKRK